MESGRCAQCHGEGVAGEPCVSPGCRLRRYHYVPAAFVTATPSDDVMLGRVVADFMVVGVVGSGGFGHVHHVLQLPLRGRPVQGALKRLRVGGDGERATLLQRFESEADALASLSHPHIVRLLKAGFDGETPYLVIELVTDAVTLEREIDDHRGQPMPDDEIGAIIGQTLNALEAAHAQGIVHRDVKPGNIMLQQVAGYEVFVRVLDFGLAKFIAEGSQTERVMGTLDYMAPEQLRGKDIGPWTDLYALGLVLLTMLAGRPAFSPERAVLVGEKLDPNFDPVGRALGTRLIDASKVAFLRTATAFDRNARYRDVAAFRRAFMDVFGRARTARKLARTRDLSVVPAPREIVAPQRISPAPPSVAPQRATPIVAPQRTAPQPAGSKVWPLLAAVEQTRDMRREQGPPKRINDTVDEPRDP